MNKKISHVFLLLLFVLSFSVPVMTHALNTDEVNIKNYVSQHQEESLVFLEKLVNINSGTENLHGVRQIGEILRPQFEQLGFDTRWVEEPADMHRAGTLIAEKKGSKGKRLLLIGHLDTVFNPDSPFQHFLRQGDKVIGPGVIDDKGGDVVILYALKALQAAHLLDGVSITVVLTGDEEDSGKPVAISRKPLIEMAKQSDIALDFEWSLGINTATVARRGISGWRITTQGNALHSSEIFRPDVGDGAIFELARILNTMRLKMQGEKYLTFSPGLVLGGETVDYDKNKLTGTALGKSNIVAKTAMANGDLRFLTKAQKKSAQDQIANIVKQNLSGTTATVVFQDAIPAMPPTPGNLQLLEQYSTVSVDLGYPAVKPTDPGLRGAADISHIADSVSANLAGLGPVGTGAHATSETLNISSLPIAIQRAAILIYLLTR